MGCLLDFTELMKRRMFLMVSKGVGLLERLAERVKGTVGVTTLPPWTSRWCCRLRFGWRDGMMPLCRHLPRADIECKLP